VTVRQVNRQNAIKLRKFHHLQKGSFIEGEGHVIINDTYNLIFSIETNNGIVQRSYEDVANIHENMKSASVKTAAKQTELVSEVQQKRKQKIEKETNNTGNILTSDISKKVQQKRKQQIGKKTSDISKKVRVGKVVKKKAGKMLASTTYIPTGTSSTSTSPAPESYAQNLELRNIMSIVKTNQSVLRGIKSYQMRAFSELRRQIACVKRDMKQVTTMQETKCNITEEVQAVVAVSAASTESSPKSQVCGTIIVIKLS
jgi:hypothetical protein